jgi:hypothetical protein
MTVRKKVFWIVVSIVIAAIIITLCVSYFTGGKTTEYNGTLVKWIQDSPRLV